LIPAERLAVRIQYHLQERHLAEAVRRKVITDSQREALLALARSMAAAEGGAAPDLGWIDLVQGTVAAAAAGVFAIWLLDNLYRLSPVALLAYSLAATACLWGLGFAIRRTGQGRIAAAVLTTGAIAFSWAVGAGVCTLAMAYAGGISDIRYVRGFNGVPMLVHAAGDLAVLCVALVVGLWCRLASAAAPAAIAAACLGYVAVAFLSDVTAAASRIEESSWFLVSVAVGMLGAARVWDRRYRGRLDPAFWLHATGLVLLEQAAATGIHASPRAVFAWTVIAVAIAWLGLRWDRRIYPIAAGAALIWFATSAAGRAGWRDSAGIGVLFASCLLVLVAAAWLRRRYLALWLADAGRQLDRSVWA
jgi:hypothetical protein